MANRRDAIKMTQQEVDEFLDGRHTMNVATIGKDGRPHLVAMWYGYLDGQLAFWTFGKSQKVVNLRRDPRVRVRIGEETFAGEARSVAFDGAEHERARDLLVGKYATAEDDLAEWRARAVPVAIALSAA